MLMLIGILFLIFNVICWKIYTDEDLKSFHIWLGGGWVVGKANLSALALDLNLWFVFYFQTRSELIIKEK